MLSKTPNVPSLSVARGQETEIRTKRKEEVQVNYETINCFLCHVCIVLFKPQVKFAGLIHL